ncbi:MAG: phage portal protein [Arenicella sp.]|nr:phage portal protein [Arenicella sp.]
MLNASGQPMAESFAGASRSSQELMFFDPDNADIDAAIESEGGIINARAKDLVRNNADVSGGLDQSNATIVGSKYRFNCKANHRILGISEEQANDWNFRVESITSAYLNSSSNYVDVQRKRNFVQMLSQVNTSSFIYGESFFSREHKKNRTGIGTCFQILNPERIETPFNKKAVWVLYRTNTARPPAITFGHQGNRIYLLKINISTFLSLVSSDSKFFTFLTLDLQIRRVAFQSLHRLLNKHSCLINSKMLN